MWIYIIFKNNTPTSSLYNFQTYLGWFVSNFWAIIDAKRVKMAIITSGVGWSSSATCGANIPNILAITLQYPNTVADRIVGINSVFAMKHKPKAAETPKTETMMRIGHSSALS